MATGIKNKAVKLFENYLLLSTPGIKANGTISSKHL